MSSYAQIEFLFSDLVKRCSEIEFYSEFGGTLPFPVKKRLRRARKILEAGGPLAEFAPRLLKILDRFEDREEIRNILAHGFMIVTHDANKSIQYEFRKLHWDEAGQQGELIHRCFEVNLDYEAAQLSALAQEASLNFEDVHKQLGWTLD